MVFSKEGTEKSRGPVVVSSEIGLLGRVVRNKSNQLLISLKVSRSQNKIVEPQNLPKKRTNEFVFLS